LRVVRAHALDAGVLAQSVLDVRLINGDIVMSSMGRSVLFERGSKVRVRSITSDTSAFEVSGSAPDAPRRELSPLGTSEMQGGADVSGIHPVRDDSKQSVEPETLFSTARAEALVTQSILSRF
jgi:hypothetical protein